MTREETLAIFHNLWSRDVGRDGYDKEKWKRLEAELVMLLKDAEYDELNHPHTYLRARRREGYVSKPRITRTESADAPKPIEAFTDRDGDLWLWRNYMGTGWAYWTQSKEWDKASIGPLSADELIARFGPLSWVEEPVATWP